MKVLIIGANKGIGLALTQKFIKEGHSVTSTCRNPSAELIESGARVITDIEVTSQNSINKLASEIDSIDILIHCAGVLISDGLTHLNIQDIKKQFEINTIAPLMVVSTLQDKMVSGGKIGLISSRMGSISDNNSGGQYGYRISKTGLNAIGRSLAHDLKADNKTVILLHPGYVRTQMTNGNGLIDPPESAAGLYKIMMEKTIEQTGTFWHTNGEELPW